MKIAFRNFLTTLRRYKVSSLLNIIGLTLAFTAFYIIMSQVWWELNYNCSIPDADRICMIAPSDVFGDETGYYMATGPRPSSERFIEQSPEVEAGGCFRPYFNAVEPLWVLRDGDYVPMTGVIFDVSAGLIDVLCPATVDGDLHAISRPGTVLLSRSEARRLGLGVGDALFRTKQRFNNVNPRPEVQLEVAGIYEDFPVNSRFAQVTAMSDLGDVDISASNNWNDVYFVRLRKGADRTELADRWTKVHGEAELAFYERIRPQLVEYYGEEEADKWLDEEPCACLLLPLSELYFDKRLSDSTWAAGSITTTLSLLAIAILVIAVALINFINFFFALMPARLRTVNIFKVFGAPTSSLRFSFLFEAVGFVVVSLLLGWYIAAMLQSTHFANYVSTSLSLVDNLAVAGLEAGVALIAILIAGLYPAWYITSFDPAQAAKGSFAGSRSGRYLRTGLLAVQYIVSMALIVFTFFCYAQHRFVQRFDMGFDRDWVLTFSAPNRIAKQSEAYEALVSRLKRDPRIEGVTGAGSEFVSEGVSIWGREWKGREMMLHIRSVHGNFLDVLRIPIVEGENFKPGQERDSVKRIIFAAETAREYDIRPGERFDGGFLVTGICQDLYFRPLQFRSAPFAMIINRSTAKIMVRVTPGCDIEAVSDHIRQSVAEVDPESSTPDIRFMNDEIQALYGKEDRLATIIALFAMLSVVIALMGVFGLVLFETQHRRREIAVRKVMGATTREILQMFNRRYVIVTLVCFVVAAPVAWWGVDVWMKQFAYRMPFAWWIYAVALAAVLALTVLTVTVRSWYAANENPVNAVKSE